MKSQEDQKHIEELQGDIKRGKEDLSKLTTEYKLLEADNQRLQDEITEHKATIVKRDSKLVAEEDNSKDLEKQLHEKEDDIAYLENEKQSVEDASKIENYESQIKALEAQKKMALDDKAEAEKTAADQSDRRKKMEDQVKALNAQ
ncbi:hypothetical protein EIN_339630, partial [Entamoeba invadens IP1]